MEAISSKPKWLWKSCTILSLGTIPYQRTIRWVWTHNQYLKVKHKVPKQSRWEAMDVRVQSPKSMKDKDMESWIYNKMIGTQSPKYLKDQGVESWKPWSRSGRKVLNLLRHYIHAIRMRNLYSLKEKYHSWATPRWISLIKSHLWQLWSDFLKIKGHV